MKELLLWFQTSEGRGIWQQAWRYHGQNHGSTVQPPPPPPPFLRRKKTDLINGDVKYRLAKYFSHDSTILPAKGLASRHFVHVCANFFYLKMHLVIQREKERSGTIREWQCCIKRP